MPRKEDKMKIKVGTTKIDDVIQALDKQTQDGITFTYTGVKRGINAEFDCNTDDFSQAKAAAKKIIKSHEEFAALFVSIQ